MFDFITKFFKREPPQETRISAINIPSAGFSTWTGSAYANDIYRAGIDAIARNAGKLKPVHVIVDDGQKQPANDRRIQRLLQVSPNPYMTSYDLLYKMTTQYFLFNNAFALLDWQGGKLSGIYPINFTHAEIQMDDRGELFTEFTLKNGRKAQFRYQDLIHLRRHFNGNEFLGDDNRALDVALELAHAQNEGILSSIKNGGNLRGILKLAQVSRSVDAKEIQENFIKDYLNLSNNGGVAIMDSRADYIPLNQAPQQLDSGQTAATKDKIYSYLGISEKIVNSSYSEDEFSAFYESVIEPLATLMSLEFTRKIFTDREQGFGNQIVFESGRLQFTSNSTKVSLIKELLPLQLLTINEAREVLNMAPVDGGDVRLQTLNVVDADKANTYQLGKVGERIGNTDSKSDDGNTDET